MGKKKSPAFDKIENKQSRLGTFLKKRNGLFKKAKEFSTIDGPSIAVAGSSTITAESPSIDFMLDEFFSNAVGSHSIDTTVGDFISDATGYPSIDSILDEFLSNAVGSPSIDTKVDDFISHGTGYPSIDSMLDEYLYNVVGSPSIDTRVDDFISDATGYPSIDPTVDECLATTTASSFQNTIKAMSEFDLEAWDDLEEIPALRRVSWTKSPLTRERTRLM